MRAATIEGVTPIRHTAVGAAGRPALEQPLGEATGGGPRS